MLGKKSLKWKKKKKAAAIFPQQAIIIDQALMPTEKYWLGGKLKILPKISFTYVLPLMK